jgi:hypothetical protein
METLSNAEVLHFEQIVALKEFIVKAVRAVVQSQFFYEHFVQ